MADLPKIKNPACRDADPDIFFPEKGTWAEPALRVCFMVCAQINGPDVMSKCIMRDEVILKRFQQIGMTGSGSVTGVVGGTTAKDRRRVARGDLTLEEVWESNARMVGAQPPEFSRSASAVASAYLLNRRASCS